MPNFGLFLTFQFQTGGNFDDNGRQRIRRPDLRFWDMVLPDTVNDDIHFHTRSTRQVEVLGSNPLTYAPESTRINADTRTMEMVARRDPLMTDRVFFAVHLDTHGINPPRITNIRFACSVHPGVKVSKSTVASPFRDGNEIQCHLSTAPTKFISSIDPENPLRPPIIYSAIGSYPLTRDPGIGLADSECCFHKLTVVATASRPNGPNPDIVHEFAYDPDMDVEMGL
jgi:hypothetical protein